MPCKLNVAVLATALQLVSLAESANAQDSLVSLEYQGIHDTKVIESGEPAKIALFRVKNLTDREVAFPTRARRPQLLIRYKSNNEWKEKSRFVLCAMGLGVKYIKPDETRLFWLDPSHYRNEYGPNLQFGVAVGYRGQRDYVEVWCDPVQLPEIRNPDSLKWETGFFPAKTKPK